MRSRGLLGTVLVLVLASLSLRHVGGPSTVVDPASPTSPGFAPEDGEEVRFAQLAARAQAAGLPIPPSEGRELKPPRVRKGYEVARWHYTKMNYPYGPRLPRAIVEQMIDAKKLRPDEDDYGPFKASDPWEFVGPSGLDVRGSSRRDSGRVTDIEWRSDTGVRVATANGGLWRYDILGIPTPMADGLDVLCIGSFDTHPTSPNTILVGTGDPVGATGAGLYTTGSGGTTWSKVVGGPDVDAFFLVRYSPWSANEIHAATTGGHWRFDVGPGWQAIRTTTSCSSLAFNPDVPGAMLAGFWNDGIYWTTNSGDVWNEADISAIVPDGMVRRVSVTICRDQPANAWALVSRPGTAEEDDEDQIGWLLRSTDGGMTWNDVGLPGGFPTRQGDYNHVVAVHPKEPNTVLVGGVELWRTTNGGADWTKLSGLHADHHVIEWTPAGANVYGGNDGGLYQSTDAGATWTSPNNFLPVTQFYSVDVCATDPTMVTGGAQDNGAIHTLDLLNWEEHLGGDAGGVAIDPEACNLSLVTTGVWSGGGVPKYRPQRSSDTFGSWDIKDNGIDDDDEEWTPWIRTAAGSSYFYLHDENDVYRSTNDGDDWIKISGPAGILAAEVLTVERTNWGAVYVCTTDEDYAGMQRAWVYRDGAWSSVDDPAFPSVGIIRKITPHPKLLGTAYAVVSDATVMGPGAAVFMTEDWGETWTDISTILTDVIPTDVVAHPDDPNQIYVGTQLGVVWTPNRGTDWLDWEDGMPSGCQITEMLTVPTGSGVPGEYWLYASTFGRGMWRRMITAPAPGNPDVALSTVEASVGILYSRPDGSGEALSDIGSTIRVQIVDSNHVPVPGIEANRITLAGSFANLLEFCDPVPADAPTDEAGWTTFSGTLPVGGNSGVLRVLVDGASLAQDADVRVRSADLTGDLRVDLCDLERFTSDKEFFVPSRSDLNGDGTIDIADAVLLDAAMEDAAHCPGIDPLLLPAEGELGLWFDAAGTQFGRLAQRGDYVDLYLVARGFTNSIRALEFQIPALAHPAVDVTFRSWNHPEASFQSLTAAHEFQLVFGDPAPYEIDLEVVLGMIRVQLRDDVRNLRFCIQPMNSSSFGSPAAAGWINGLTPCSLTPFAATSCAEINPFPGDVWAGFEHEPLGPAELVPLGTHLALQGLDTPVAGGVRIHFGGRYPGSTKHDEMAKGVPEPDTAPVDGAGVFFGNALFAANLSDGANLEFSYQDPIQVPTVITTTHVLQGVAHAEVDMSALGSEELRVTLLNDGQELISSVPFDGLWECDQLLPAVTAALHQNDRLVLLHLWSPPATVTISGNDYVVDEMQIETAPGLVVPEGLISSAVLTGSQIPQIQITTEAIQRFGTYYSVLDNSLVKSEADQLRFLLEEAGMPGQIRIEADDQPVELFSLPPGPNEMNANLVLHFEARSESQLPPVTLELENGPTVRLRSDLSQIGAQSWLARGFAGGVLQWELDGSGSDVADASAWPLRAVMTSTGIEVGWSSPVDVSAVLAKASGTPSKNLAPIDVLELVPQQPASALPTGEIVVATFDGFSSWEIVAEPMGTPSPSPRMWSTALHANVPNPFNPSTKLRFSLARAGRVRLDIFDQRGRIVRRLVDDIRPEGKSTVIWNGRDDAGASVASGVYHVRLQAEGVTSSRKITLVK